MRVRVGSVLYGYTGGRSELEASGETVAAVLEDLERRCPGLVFRVVDEQGRVRPHMRLFVGSEAVRDLSCRVRTEDEISILGALSGG